MIGFCTVSTMTIELTIKVISISLFGCVCAVKLVVLLDFVYATRIFRWNSLLVFFTISLFTAMLSALSGSTVSRSNSRWISSFNKFLINRSPILSSARFSNLPFSPTSFEVLLNCLVNWEFHFFSVFAEQKEGLAPSKSDVKRSYEGNF